MDKKQVLVKTISIFFSVLKAGAIFFTEIKKLLQKKEIEEHINPQIASGSVSPSFGTDTYLQRPSASGKILHATLKKKKNLLILGVLSSIVYLLYDFFLTFNPAISVLYNFAKIRNWIIIVLIIFMFVYLLIKLNRDKDQHKAVSHEKSTKADNIFIHLGDQLEELRHNKSLSLKQLSKNTGISENKMFRIELGQVFPNKEEFTQICKIYKIKNFILQVSKES